MSFYELRQGQFRISTDPSALDLERIVQFLGEAYWSAGRPRDVIERSLRHSLCFGLYAADDGDAQIGLARVVTDHATYAYLCDVYIDPAYRAHGLGKWLIGSVMAHPDLTGLRRWTLATRDAHEFYRQLGWNNLQAPERWMERFNP